MKLRLAGHVARMGEPQYRMLVGKLSNNHLQNRDKKITNIKMHLRKVDYEDGIWMDLLYDRVQW